MAGIYIHIPFCRKACYYCDFHFTVNRRIQPEMVAGIQNELRYFGKKGKDSFFLGTTLNTIYFGGGTPSLLKPSEIEQILDTIRKNYTIDPKAEITLEANPDDLTDEYCNALKSLGVNRLSIGIQSFDDDQLRWMNRSHNSRQALRSVENAHKAGFDSISIDLIYGVPGLTTDGWLDNLNRADLLSVNHLSAYSLTVEERTPLRKLIGKGKYPSTDEDVSSEHFSLLMDWAGQRGWDHYEISNLCRGNAWSKHNTAYWQGELYLGVGPAAHSYNGEQRRWNPRDNMGYVKSWQEGNPVFETEELSPRSKFNDLILTTLRTRWGLSLKSLTNIGGDEIKQKVLGSAGPFVTAGMLEYRDETLFLTREGKYFADYIASELFLL